MTGYSLGCPAWATKTWIGRFAPPGTRPSDLLSLYARTFDTVEGNTTFYALPTADVVARWRDDTPPTFRFCFKFPRAIAHDYLLVDSGAAVEAFLDCIAPLGPRLGTLWLQLPPRFDATLLPRLATFLDDLPRDHRYAVEPRHESLFGDTAAARDFLALLRERAVDLVTMDARGLHAGRGLAHAEVRARKPSLPVAARTTASRPFVRIVPGEDFAANPAAAETWAAQVAAWIADGLHPLVFLHAPDDTFAPDNAYAFHALVRAHRPEVGELPPWPGGPRQLSLL